MKWYIFKKPRSINDAPIKAFTFEPSQFLIEQEAMRSGPIEIVSEEELQKELEEGL